MPDPKTTSRPPPTATERRSAPRLRTRALVDGDVAEKGEPATRSFLGTMVNLSLGGALVRTYETLEVGQEVVLSIHLPEGQVQVAATIAHVEQDPVGCWMAGVRFGALGPGALDLLKHHISSFSAAPKRHEPASRAGESASKDDKGSRKSVREMRQQDANAFPFEGTATVSAKRDVEPPSPSKRS